MQTLQEYKCPCCGGAITFDSEIQKMKCPFCDTEFDVETLREYDAELNTPTSDEMSWESASKSEWLDGEDGDVRAYICRSCGGEIICDVNTAATSCPFCSNPVVIMPKLAGELKPDTVIPFKLDKKAAKERFTGYLSKKRLLPKLFKDENHIDEIKGIYIPFWLFDSNADVAARYRATKVRFWSDSNFNYTETRHFLLKRSGSLKFENVPVDGSKKMEDELTESLEPYDCSEAVDFKTAYLAGYFADKYDVDAEESSGRANERVKHSAESAFENTINGYTGIVRENVNIKLNDGKVRYALFPVWLLNTTWKDKKYVFAMNGQTGKFVGDLPVDKAAAAKWLAVLTAIFSVVSYLGVFLLDLCDIL